MDICWSDDDSSSVDAAPVFEASAPLSVEHPLQSTSVPSVTNCAGCSSEGGDGLDVEIARTGPVTGDARDCLNDEGMEIGDGDLGGPTDLGHGTGDAEATAGRRRGRGGDGEGGPGQASSAAASDGLQPRRSYAQSRPGPSHGKGGRKKGSGRRTKQNFGRGLRRVLGVLLSETTAENLSSDCDVPLAAAREALTLLQSWSSTTGREEVWLVPGVFGVIARWGEWRRDMHGNCASVCVWLSEDGHCRCTCVGTNVHQDNYAHGRPTRCQHAGTMEGVLEELSGALGIPPGRVREHLRKKMHRDPGAADGQAQDSDGLTFHVVGALHVAVCPSPAGALPVPLYLTATRSSCGFCPGARARVCSHLSVAYEAGAPYRGHRTSAQGKTRSLELSSVSRLPLPLVDCVAAVRTNADVCALTVAGGVFKIPAPLRCGFCTDRDKPHELSGASTRMGAIACSRGFCKMEVGVAKCSSCLQWVCRDGRDEHVVLLTMTSAATVTWVRSMALTTSEGMSLTTSVTRWIRTVRRETAAGVLPGERPARSGRVLRSIVLIGLDLMVTNLPPALFTCRHCMDADGRYECVSADSIWVGFGSGAEHVRFDHVTEAVPVNENAIRAAYLVRGESVRRVVRDVMKPRKPIKLLSKSVRAAERAVGFLVPDALPTKHAVAATEGELSIGTVLASVFDVKAAASKLLVAFKTALRTYKVRGSLESERRKAIAQHLSDYIANNGGDEHPATKSVPTPSAPSSTKAGGLAAGNADAAAAQREAADGGAELAGRADAAAAALPKETGTRAGGGAAAAIREKAVAAAAAPVAATSGQGRAAHAPRPGDGRATRPDRRVRSISLVEEHTSPKDNAAKKKRGAPATTMAPGTDGRQTKGRKPDCGRKAFVAGKGAADTNSPFLQPAVKKLGQDARRELLSSVTAITIDSVVLPFRPSHAPTLRQLAASLQHDDYKTVIGRLLSMSTSDEPLSDMDEDCKPVVEMLRELRFVQLGVRSCALLFAALPALAGALARCLLSVARSIDNFVSEWRKGPHAALQYEKTWSGGGRSQEEMHGDFKKAYPDASTNHRRTGTCAPSLPQCRPEPFLWAEVLSTGMCSKHYAKAHKFSPGAMTFCCGCKHPLILAFTVLDRKEAPQVLLNMLLTRFARIPKFLIYDFACGAFRVALGKLGWLLLDCTVVSDRFHMFNHLCSDAFDPRSYTKMDGVDTGAPEQRNAPIRRIQTTLQGMGVVPYANLLAYQTAVLNHEAQTKWSMGVNRLPEDVDLAGAYFSKFPCSC
ncbi:hypothetical protein BU14_0150s0017 [Porphyra umbilicalis]|uniref:Uncharacterized protein n=1 Tax=Porphyra umbilicalis TaxID=2786 RepID=A0A1X6P9K5_PORUM|nr:hypothetical protein BU14_0150s0017 [Porphyra umbilicalis]|eukprot:OSX77405.1 hypothetical protein BU14_0150s0017 [Porphyra umbilicalis]